MNRVEKMLGITIFSIITATRGKRYKEFAFDSWLSFLYLWTHQYRQSESIRTRIQAAGRVDSVTPTHTDGLAHIHPRFTLKIQE